MAIAEYHKTPEATKCNLGRTCRLRFVSWQAQGPIPKANLQSLGALPNKDPEGDLTFFASVDKIQPQKKLREDDRV